MARPIAKDYDDKRQHLLTEAAEVFASEGFSRASMNQVARACGVSKANIYHYYESKDALVYDILDNYLSELRDTVRAVPLEGLTPGEQLHVVVRDILIAYQGMNNEHRMLTEGLHWLPEVQREPLKQIQRDIVDVVARILTRIAPEALQDDPTLRRQVTMSVFGMLNWYSQWNSGAGRQARIDYARVVTNLALNGLLGRQSL